MSEPEKADADDPVPKLPRMRAEVLGTRAVRIALTLLTLIGVIVLAKPCSNAVSKFVTGFDDGSNKPMPKPGNVDMPRDEQYEQLKPGMTEQELKAAVERAKARAAGSGSTGSASAGSSAPAPSP